MPPSNWADISITATNAKITPKNMSRATVALEEVDIEEVIEQIGTDVILNVIGKEAVIEHFDITEAETE